MRASTQLYRLAARVKGANLDSKYRKAEQGLSDILDFYQEIEELASQAVAQGGRLEAVYHDVLQSVQDRRHEIAGLEVDLAWKDGKATKAMLRAKLAGKHSIRPPRGQSIARIVNNEGVERVFPLHSPKVAGVDVISSGHTRRAKLYYLRERAGKAARVKQRCFDGYDQLGRGSAKCDNG